jgi:predicted negative regulator of RcsB-dependent stress response
MAMNNFMTNGELDAEKWIEANKKNLTIVGIVLLFALLGGSIWYNSRNASNEVYNAKIEKSDSTAFANFSKDKNVTPLMGDFKKLKNEVGNYRGLFPYGLKISDALLESGMNNEAIEVLLAIKDNASTDYAKFFVNARLAVAFENAGKINEAIDVLLQQSKSGVAVFEGKNYLDLGRLYLKQGQKDKAKSSFQYVIDHAKDDIEFVKLSKLYLSNL